jgi:hypothetical protein
MEFSTLFCFLAKNIDKTKSKGACNWKKTWNGIELSIRSYKDEALDIIMNFGSVKSSELKCVGI